MLQEKLTSRQQQIFDFICSRIEDDGFGPTIREIAEEMEFRSPNGVMCHLRALEKKGLITRSSNKSRSIVLTEQANEEVKGLPLAGRVAAGALMEAIEQTERINMGALWTRKGTYVLEVAGDSMIECVDCRWRLRSGRTEIHGIQRGYSRRAGLPMARRH